MIFNQIVLENFGAIKRFSKSFGTGIFVLSGDNGSGKSTVIKAVLLAVFDDYSGSLSDYVNWESDYFQVEVDFTHQGVGYKSFVRYDGATDRSLIFEKKIKRNC